MHQIRTICQTSLNQLFYVFIAFYSASMNSASLQDDVSQLLFEEYHRFYFPVASKGLSPRPDGSLALSTCHVCKCFNCEAHNWLSYDQNLNSIFARSLIVDL